MKIDKQEEQKDKCSLTEMCEEFANNSNINDKCETYKAYMRGAETAEKLYEMWKCGFIEGVREGMNVVLDMYDGTYDDCDDKDL